MVISFYPCRFPQRISTMTSPSAGRLQPLFWVSISHLILTQPYVKLSSVLTWSHACQVSALCSVQYPVYLPSCLSNHSCCFANPAFEFLESIAYSGIALNLVVYLGTVLHGTTASNAANVDAWNGATFLTPVLGAFLADTYWGKYKTVTISIIFYLVVSAGTISIQY